MRRNSPGAFLRTSPRGEIRKFSKGGVSKGPIIRPDNNTSLFSSSVTSRGFSKALLRFLDRQVTLSPKYRIEKPKRKPFLRGKSLWPVPACAALLELDRNLSEAYPFLSSPIEDAC